MARSRAALVVVLLSAAPAAAGGGARTRLELTDPATGAILLSRALADGERAVLTWTNSLFRLRVTEEFVARGGGLELDAVTFADPRGAEPPRVRPEDVDDLYHTGGPFRAEGLARPLRRVIFRVGEIGDPTLRAGGEALRFVDAVGFGGAVVMEARPIADGGDGTTRPRAAGGRRAAAGPAPGGLRSASPRGLPPRADERSSAQPRSPPTSSPPWTSPPAAAER